MATRKRRVKRRKAAAKKYTMLQIRTLTNAWYKEGIKDGRAVERQLKSRHLKAGHDF